jgi:hypothetical protein
MAEHPYMHLHSATFEDGVTVTLQNNSSLRKQIYDLLPAEVIPAKHRVHNLNGKCFLCLVYSDVSRAELVQHHRDNGVEFEYIDGKMYEPIPQRAPRRRKRPVIK